MDGPIIGLTTYHGETSQGLPAVLLLRAYVQAITNAGGVPVLLPLDLAMDKLPILVRNLDGLLLTGGGDISPQYFKGGSHPRIDKVDALRDEFEFSICQSFLQEGKPILGICRGCQVINVSMGGTLYTHIEDQHPSPIKHDYYPDWPRDRLSHAIELISTSQLAADLKEDQFQVNSLHHQGIKELAEGLDPAAYAPDGLIEAVEYKNASYVVGVQWHPEWLTAHLVNQRLFKAFVSAAGKIV